MSFKFPIGVATIYKLIILQFILYCFIFLISCSPANLTKQTTLNKKPELINVEESKNESNLIEKKLDPKKEFKVPKNPDLIINRTVTVLFSKNENQNIINQFINIIEMGVYDKKLENINLEIKYFNNNLDLKKIIFEAKEPGKVFIGPINNEHTEILKDFCDEGLVFFTFSSDTNLAKDCIFLMNFFPKNELEQLFAHLNSEAKVALLYPENKYGYKINELIDEVVNNSEAVLINRASYKKDLSNVRDAIKELGKYELRKYELNRQKQILISRKDDKSKKRLKKLERFKTTSDYDFTHVLIADYGLNLLQVAPLLTYYDIDPNIVQFMGTGVIDDENFFFEPSLQNAIFPGVEKDKRKKILLDYQHIYGDNFIRISTLPYDLVGILNYIFSNNVTINQLIGLLNNTQLRFDGVDGNFYFKNNLIERDLNILKISKGKAISIN